MTIEKYCLQCGESLPDYEPVNKQYCSDACKQRAYRDRLTEPEPETPETDSADEDGLHPLAWIGMIGLGAWLLRPTGQTRNKAVSTRPVPPTWPTLDEL